jgi:hypothetical protein
MTAPEQDSRHPPVLAGCCHPRHRRRESTLPSAAYRACRSLTLEGSEGGLAVSSIDSITLSHGKGQGKRSPSRLTCIG